MNFAIVGISGKALSGKSTAHKAITELMKTKESCKDYRVIYSPLAEKLKEICTDLFDWDGDKGLYYNEDGSLKQDKGRQLLINVGTNKLREIRPTVWVDYVAKKIMKNIQNTEYNNTIFIIDDIRFRNEMETLAKFGKKFVSIRLSRKSQLNLETESEIDLDGYTEFDYFLDNNGTVEDLGILLDQVIDDVISRSKGRVHA